MLFSQKRKELIINCDSYIDLYDRCNIGCEMCKFNREVYEVNKINIDFNKYYNKRVLVCYKVDPYTNNDYDLVKITIEKLHNNNCKVVFLTRKATHLIKQLHLFNKDDFIGVSISENCTKNSNIDEVIKLLKTAKSMNINTWVSLEPVITAEFANDIIYKIKNYSDLIRIGKDDLIEYNWDNVIKHINKENNVYIKNN